jgi:hypothetical protein
MKDAHQTLELLEDFVHQAVIVQVLTNVKMEDAGIFFK